MKLRTDPITAMMVIGILSIMFLEAVWTTGRTCSGSCLICSGIDIECDQGGGTQSGIPDPAGGLSPENLNIRVTP